VSHRAALLRLHSFLLTAASRLPNPLSIALGRAVTGIAFQSLLAHSVGQYRLRISGYGCAYRQSFRNAQDGNRQPASISPPLSTALRALEWGFVTNTQLSAERAHAILFDTLARCRVSKLVLIGGHPQKPTANPMDIAVSELLSVDMCVLESIQKNAHSLSASYSTTFRGEKTARWRVGGE
jgi:hypothetical protein